ncbi:MAG: aminomethyl-transferring glycine dehydrogenase [Acidimicrobiia bacterium]
MTEPSPHEDLDAFAHRHLGPRPADLGKMLAEVGAGSLDELISSTVPPGIRDDRLQLPPAMTERDALAVLAQIASKNRVLTSLIGLGYHGTITPPVVKRNVLEDPAWYTAYTPYQPEISQGRLEALLNYQTMVADLAGLDLANASLLDEGTAAAEAMAMVRRISRKETRRFYVDVDCHPHTIAILESRAAPVDIEVAVVDAATVDPADAFGLLVQYPGSSGRVRDLRAAAARSREAGTMVVVAADLLALVLLEPPGAWGADVVVGSAQRFGVPLGFGGPHAGYLATRTQHVRSLPGRLVGVSHDSQGRTALRLAIQTREQHIRRERATSNVCTAQVLLAVIAGLYAVWHGPEGLTRIATRVYDLTSRLVAGLRAGGIAVVGDTWFDTITVTVPGGAGEVVAAALERGINLRLVDDDTVGVTLDETTTDEIVGEVLAAFGAGSIPETGPSGIPGGLQRTREFLTHPVFHRYRSEHDMLRYLRSLADRDLALDRSMIPLGSCTMKLNATSEMEPITWPEFSDIHPFAPLDQAGGYLRIIGDLETWLAEITGYDAVSLQPNAGSQGELSGLLAIRAYHGSRGEAHRDICLIPSSAHGTNAASAAMAGLQVVVVACDESGDVDLTDLRQKADQHADRLAAAMVTYPSTHGVFEEGIGEICRIVHDRGGQVYVDGANLNALVGLAKPGRFGADVSHLNLHKTFTIPHGGGGPGVGPIGVKAHLAPFLPNHPLRPEAGPETGIGPVSMAPWGSAGILPISWMYVAMMGANGLRMATEVAILNANYLARRLDPHFPVLYSGRNGRVAHECIVDIRPLTKETGITAEDVAKRLADYGFHAPTLSFPVAGTLMIEPTESEPLAELDRFCDAMIAIRREIGRVEAGDWDPEDNPLKNAPHTAEDVSDDTWAHPYLRSEAAFPLPGLRTAKYWPPVSRIDGASGDRHLMCSCPPVESFVGEAGPS